MRKKIKNFMLFSLPFLPVITVFSCTKTNDDLNKKDENKIDDNVNSNKTDNNNKITNPDEKNQEINEDYKKGGLVNGLNVDFYKELISHFGILSTKLPSLQISNLKAGNYGQYQISNVNVISYNDQNKNMQIEVSGSYNKQKFDNQIINIINFNNEIYGESIYYEFDKEKLASEKLNSLDEILNLENEELLSYFKELKIYGGSFEFVDLKRDIGNENSRIILKKLSLKKQDNSITLHVNADFKLQAFANQKTSEIKTVNLFNKTIKYNLSSFQFSTLEYLNYLINNKLEAIEKSILDNNGSLNHFPSYYLGKSISHIDLTHKFYKLPEKYEYYKNSPIAIKAESVLANDIEGKLHVKYILNWEDEKTAQNLNSISITKTIEGFGKKVNEEFIKKSFWISTKPNAFHEMNSTSPAKVKYLMDLYKKSDRNSFLIEDDQSLTRLFGRKEFLFLANHDGSTTESNFIPSKYFDPFYIAEKIEDLNNNHFSANFLTDVNNSSNDIFISNLKFVINSLDNFDLVQTEQGENLNFYINGTLEISILNSDDNSSILKEFSIEVPPLRTWIKIQK